MDAITTYIDHMFRGLPRNAEVLRARGELEQMSLDRFHELRAEGVSENEAVGRVIAQFGNLEEIADDLGIREQLGAAVDPTQVAFVDRGEGEALLRSRGRMAWLIAGGVAVIMAGLCITVLLEGRDLAVSPLTGGMFLVAVAIAVGLFVLGGLQTSQFKHLESRRVQLEEPYEQELHGRMRAGQSAFVTQLVGGIVIIILGVAATATLDGMGVGDASAVCIFVGVAIGVALILHAAVRRSTFAKLLGEGKFELVSDEQRKSNSLISRIAGPYWLLAVAVFLVWSFGWNAWEQSWLVWPVAGVLFAFVAALVHSIRNTSDA